MNMEIMERIVPEAIREAERLNSPWLSVFKIFGDERKVYGAGIILLEALSSADSATKISAAFFLGVCPYWTAWSKLSELLSDLDPRVYSLSVKSGVLRR
ncbi:MAG: hypothetical protein NTW50_01160 [Candidatus Berkelbacteria bacterium]|nr:hypothetical protein [Candidatus Berkelbacteria bacterium]